mmetsp:Transcript_25264/g.35397  ORF Transcript_25264/g.35397 Transcript_25264/m.35397 type:complete len:108 (+) Transcript_25264:119-442(+)
MEEGWTEAPTKKHKPTYSKTDPIPNQQPTLSTHVLKDHQERQQLFSQEDTLDTYFNPQQIVEHREPHKFYHQSLFKNGLLILVVARDSNPWTIVSALYTTNINKYWK